MILQNVRKIILVSLLSFFTNTVDVEIVAVMANQNVDQNFNSLFLQGK